MVIYLSSLLCLFPFLFVTVSLPLHSILSISPVKPTLYFYGMENKGVRMVEGSFGRCFVLVYRDIMGD